MNRLVFILSGFLILISVHVNSQLFGKKSPVLQGRFTDKENDNHLAFVHILNESKRTAAISDTSGLFQLKVDIGDTLAFSALGYLGKVIIVDEHMLQSCLSIQLVPRTYDIDEVKVIALGTYSQFKQKFQNLELPYTKTDRLRDHLNMLAVKAGEEGYQEYKDKKIAEDGVSIASVPILTPEERQLIKLKEILKEEKIQKIIDKKYNSEIVADLTGLKGDELIDFMSFCNFKKQYLLNTKQYDILVKVLEKFKEFKKMQKSGSLEQKNMYV